MEWISNVLVLEKLVLIENARLKTAQTMVIKYMYNGQLYMLRVLFFLSPEQYVLFDNFSVYIYQGHVWYHCGLHILRVCCLYTMINNLHLKMHVTRSFP